MRAPQGYPGQITYAREPVMINRSRRAVKLLVKNTGDRPVQVGSHFHFFEVNRALEFDRAKAFGTHLDIQAGLSVRFEPGDEKAVSLVEFGGTGALWGFNDLTRGKIRSESVRRKALKTARVKGFRGA